MEKERCSKYVLALLNKCNPQSVLGEAPSFSNEVHHQQFNKNPFLLSNAQPLGQTP